MIFCYVVLASGANSVATAILMGTGSSQLKIFFLASQKIRTKKLKTMVNHVEHVLSGL